MSSARKAKSVVFLTAGLILAAATPSFALSIINPAYADPQSAGQTANSVSAFSNGGDAMGGASTVLTAEEIGHIRWCAERYSTYHASDNTYADASGARLECRSR